MNENLDSQNWYVIKRNKRKKPFDMAKIDAAVTSAYQDVRHCDPPYDILVNLHTAVKNLYLHAGVEEIHVEDIQDTVEKCLMDFKEYDVAKAYIIYREKHNELRFIKERVDYMERYSDQSTNAATSSETDANANVAIKNVANLDGEVYKTTNRKIQRYRMKKELEKEFPGDPINIQYAQDIDNHIVYVHDEASSPAVKNYCEAVTLYPLLVDGTGGMDGLNTTPPKNLSSFCGQLVNLTFLLSSQCKGAVAFGEFFNFLDYFCAKDYGEDYHKRQNDLASEKPKRTVLQSIHQAYQQIVYGWNQPAGNRSYQSPFTNISYYDSNYWHALFDDFCFPDGTKPVWERVDFLQRDFMQWFNKERTKTLLTFPVETMALLSDDKDILDKDYKDFTNYMYSKGHSFFTYISDNPDSLSSCCRLKNKLDSNTFSFTNGLTGVQTGSANVITLNLNRIIQNCDKKLGIKEHGGWRKNEAFIKEYLVEILNRVYKYHTAYKNLLYEVEKKGMLNASTAGYIRMNKLYSTIGLNGINEAAEYLGMECGYNDDYKDFCRLITGTISEQNKLHSRKNYQFNTEFVPAEGLSSKNYNWDKADGYWVPENRVLYNSYFYLADDESTSVLDKFRLHGREFTELLDGGVGLHCNLKDHLTMEQYSKLMDFAIANGTSYYTFNIPNSECTECGHIIKYPVETCPKCGGRMRHWTRVIGFLRPVECFDQYRYIEAQHRYYEQKSDVGNDLRNEKKEIGD